MGLCIGDELTLKPWAYYNEHDRFAAQWLRELIKAKHIAPGEVDERNIQDIQVQDLKGFTQCHFFSGIGVWSYALRKAGWPDDLQVWTGSCPCQPFSVSGKRRKFADERHLWPFWFDLIKVARPGLVFGEQVASDDGLAWLDLVSSDLEGQDYTIGAVDTCAAGFGAPMQSQRLYFVAEAGSKQRRLSVQQRRPRVSIAEIVGGREVGRMASAAKIRHERNRGARRRGIGFANCSAVPGLHLSEKLRLRKSEAEERRGTGERTLPNPQLQADTSGKLPDTSSTVGAASPSRLQNGQPEILQVQRGGGDEGRTATEPSATSGFWEQADWLYCRDDKYRPVEPGTFPLAHGAPARVGRLRGYGNALCAPQAQAFIEAYIQTSGETQSSGLGIRTVIVRDEECVDLKK